MAFEIFIYSDMNRCTEKEYEKIFDLLSRIEIKFYNQDYVSNDDSNLLFEEKRDKKAGEMKWYAFSRKFLIFCNLMFNANNLEIFKILYKLEEKRNEYYSSEENPGKIIYYILHVLFCRLDKMWN